MNLEPGFPQHELSHSSETTDLVERRPPTRFQRIAKKAGWISLALFLLIFFTILKLPEDRLKGTVQGYVASMLAEQGISFTADESRISIGLGISYEMRNVTLRPPAPANPIQLERLGVKPSLLPLLFGKKGAKFWVEAGEGQLSGSFSMANAQIAASFEAEQLDLKQLGIPRAFAAVNASAILSGSGEISGDFANPQSLDGKMRVDLKKIIIDQQLLMGFSIPRLSISDAIADVVITDGKLRIQEFRLGREGATPVDDIRATLTGQVTLARDLSSSTLDVKSRFSFSPTVLQSFALVDALLAPGKQPDGSYSFQLSGPAYAPAPTPVPPTKE